MPGCSLGSKLPCSDGGTVCDDSSNVESIACFAGDLPSFDSSAYHLLDATTLPKGFDRGTATGRERTARVRQVLHIDSRAAMVKDRGQQQSRAVAGSVEEVRNRVS